MKIPLLYDQKTETIKDGPVDSDAEYDDRNTIKSLLKAIKSGGHEAGELHLDERLFANLKVKNPDLVFNIAEGARGRSRETLGPAILEHMNIPYTGSDGLTLALSLDKGVSKTIASSNGITTPNFAVVEDSTEIEGLNVNLPAFVKPNCEGSSMGIRKSSLVKTRDELKEQASWVINQYKQPCLIEEYAPGREFCVGLLGNEPVKVLPIAEIVSPVDFYSYEYKSQHKKDLICPAKIDKSLKEKLKKMGLKAFDVFKCRDFARVDFKLDADKKPTFLELNPLPGLSPEYSIYPSQARAGNIGYEQLINYIIDSALERVNLK